MSERMEAQQSALETTDDLRARAERDLRLTRREIGALAEDEIQRVVYELQVHQVELEIQNEELRSTQLEFEDSRARYQELYESAPDGYLSLDSTGKIQRANAAGSLLLRTPVPRLIGTAFTRFVDVEDLFRLQNCLQAAETEGATCELSLVQMDRGVAYVRLVARRVHGLEPGWLLALTDISDLQAAQEKLNQLNRELEIRIAARTAELETRNRELEEEIRARESSEAERRALEQRMRDGERLESLGLLAGGIAHDFNNLLVGVVGNADLLLENAELSDEVRESVRLIERAGRSASDLTRQLLVYAGQRPVILEPLDLASIVTECLELLQSRIPDGIVLKRELHGGLWARANRVQLKQVITNLVTNAVEAQSVRGSGTITLRTRSEAVDAATLEAYQQRGTLQPGEFALLEVSDSGQGMDAASVKRIFEPFFTTKSTGRGLGLASVLGIVYGHDGALRARSTLGEGSVFEILLPLSAAPKASENQFSKAAVKWIGSGCALVIDDDAEVRGVITRQLTHIGFEVIACADGVRGLHTLRTAERPFALVVLDQTMPGMSGEQVLQAIRVHSPTLPVVMISGKALPERGLPDARVTFVNKPTTLAELREAARRVVVE